MWLGTVVRVWRVPGGGENDNGGFVPYSLQRVKQSMVHNPGRPALAFSADQRVLGFCEDAHITLWSGGAGGANSLPLDYPSPFPTWYRDDAFPYVSGAMAFSPDAKMLAVGGRTRAAIWKIVK